MSGSPREVPTTVDDPPPISADIEWCHSAVQEVSRTFAITIDVLENPMSTYVCVGYLLCRVADTVEDARHIPPAEQAALLRSYDRVLDPESPVDGADFVAAVDPWIPESPDRPADWRVVRATPRIIRAFDGQPSGVKRAIRPPVRELVSGMTMFIERYAEVGGLRIQTRAELEEYCYFAAGTVGELITNLACRGDVDEETERRLYDVAPSFGLLLQLVNIAKDVHTDFHDENNVYLPARWLRAAGIDQEALEHDHHADRIAAVIRRTADHARSYLDDAQRYLELVPETDGNRIEAWAIPYLLAVGTLRELQERPEHAASGRGVKISRSEVHSIVGTAIEDMDRRSLGRLRRTIERKPFHEAGGA